MQRYENFEFSISDPDETDLVIVSLHDKRTNFTVRTALPNHGKQTASIMAFAGARYSRSDLSARELFKEIRDSGKNANKKLANIFKNYGHASVADMAMLFAYIENIPQIYAFKFFYETSVGGGQERSTRYQDFSSSAFMSLKDYKHYFKKDKVSKDAYKQIDKQLQELQSYSLEHYEKYKEILSKEYEKVYEIDTSDKKQRSALQARVFDSARYFLLSGMNIKTSLAYITSGREWARIISMLKSCKDLYLNYLGEQLEILFAPDQECAQKIGYTPEAPDLIRHTNYDETTANNLSALGNYLKKINFEEEALFYTENKFKPIKVNLFDLDLTAGLKAVMQNIMSLFPLVDTDWLIKWLKNLKQEEREKLSDIICNDFCHHKQMGNQFRVNHYTFELISSVAEARDLNRHRAWGRFVPMLSAVKDLENYMFDGYTLPAYLTDNDNIKNSIVDEFENDLKGYYKKLEVFIKKVESEQWFPKSLLVQLLPFANICRLYLHGSVKELSYITRLRVRPGGHINYRILAYQMAEKASKADKFVSMLKFSKNEKPDPASKHEFIDRS
ncbi:hypothetical protein GF362_06685 [Candidatus Dojkabacteria bacterium]|nr:hypothetical protein [Candidatus Dojkabacteria bacterium]